jgi:hypothetical protein
MLVGPHSAMPVIYERLAGFRSQGSSRNLRSFEGKGQLGSRFLNPTNMARVAPTEESSMAQCEVCGNDYDKSFELIAAGAVTPLTASNVRFRLSLPSVNTADAR